MAATCCTTSSTSMVHLHLTILHHIQTQTTAVSLLQLITGKWHDVTNNIVLSVSPTMTRCQVLSKLSQPILLAMGLCPSVCVCLSVTSRSSTKTAERRITQATPHESPGTVVFWRQRLFRRLVQFWSFRLSDWLHGLPGLSTDTFEHIRFYFVVFLFSTVVFPCCRV